MGGQSCKAGPGHQLSHVPEAKVIAHHKEVGGVVFLDPLFPTESTKTQK